MTVLLKDALQPNLVQTLENNPAFIHGGPFANIAHGCNSVMATKTALKLADYVVTEAGFGADLGAEKFFDIKCRKAGLTPSAAVDRRDRARAQDARRRRQGEPEDENVEAVKKGCANLERHLENVAQVRRAGRRSAINHFITDTDAEMTEVMNAAESMGVEAFVCTHWADGGAGTEALARHVVRARRRRQGAFTPLYPDDLPLRDKMQTIATEIYRAADIAVRRLRRAAVQGLGGRRASASCRSAWPRPSIRSRPIPTSAARRPDTSCRCARCGSPPAPEFVVVICGEIMTMPGLPRVPAAESIRINSQGQVEGLF